MGYYMTGGYYRAGGYYRGGFFGKVGKALGKISGAASQLAPVATMINPALGMGMSSFGSVGAGLFGKKPITAGMGLPLGGGLITLPDVAAGARALDTNLGTGGLERLGLRTPGRSGATGYWIDPVTGEAKKRRRRMNVLNPRALRRGMRRVQGFARFARKTISFTQRVKMKKGRRR